MKKFFLFFAMGALLALSANKMSAQTIIAQGVRTEKICQQNAEAEQTHTYIPIADNALWSVNFAKYITRGDTTVQGKSYLKVYRQAEKEVFHFDMEKAVLHALLRNDTLNQSVYIIENFNTMQESLLYDFSMAVGDTVMANVWGDGFMTTVQRVDSAIVRGAGPTMFFTPNDSLITLNDGSKRKLIFVKFPAYYDSQQELYSVWIEGIGSYFGLLNNFEDDNIPSFCIPDNFRFLLCYEHNDQSLLSFPNFDISGDENDCFSRYIYTDLYNITISEQNTFFKLYPNPAKNELFIKSELKVEKIEIWDLSGRAAGVDLRVSPQNQGAHADAPQQIDISHLTSGVYFVKVGNTTRKLIVSR
jgi:hypothetical protein